MVRPLRSVYPLSLILSRKLNVYSRKKTTILYITISDFWIFVNTKDSFLIHRLHVLVCMYSVCIYIYIYEKNSTPF